MKAFVSFRVILALTTSTSVTSAVAGPMAYQAHQARKAPTELAAPAPTTTAAPDVAETTTTSTTVAETTTTASPTTAPPTTAPPIAVPPTVPPNTPATTVPAPPLTSEGLLVSNSADHSDPYLLQNAKLFRNVWLFFEGSGVTNVEYWIDDPTASGPSARSSTVPFDLASGGFDFSTLTAGSHSVLALVTTLNGSYQRFATFEVVR